MLTVVRFVCEVIVQMFRVPKQKKLNLPNVHAHKFAVPVQIRWQPRHLAMVSE